MLIMTPCSSNLPRLFLNSLPSRMQYSKLVILSFKLTGSKTYALPSSLVLGLWRTSLKIPAYGSFAFSKRINSRFYKKISTSFSTSYRWKDFIPQNFGPRTTEESKPVSPISMPFSRCYSDRSFPTLQSTCLNVVPPTNFASTFKD